HDLAGMLAQRVHGASGNAASPTSPQAKPGSRLSVAAPAGLAGSGGAQANSSDVQELLERLPPITLAELQPGDAILVSSTVGTNPARVTAIALASGIEPLLARPQQGPVRPGVMAGASLGLPSGVLDAGVGLPPN
ncbi:MAG TPA: hypothetical protein VGQ81_12355, partial [Acidobacteriota bacterium]|nr:hypothetical protein [Acidobacteriota bacterium]